jgi:hypothetical protein
MRTQYQETLRDPRWQRKRLKIMERDNWACAICGATDQPLNVHHLEYSGEPWEIADSQLITVCEDDHKDIEEMVNYLRKAVVHPKVFVGMKRICELLKDGEWHYIRRFLEITKEEDEEAHRPIWVILTTYISLLSESKTYSHCDKSMPATLNNLLYWCLRRKSLCTDVLALLSKHIELDKAETEQRRRELKQLEETTI